MKVGCKLKGLPLLQRLYASQGPHNRIKSMEYAMSSLVFYYYHRIYFRHGGTSIRHTNFHLTLFYQCAAEITQEQRLHVNTFNILQRVIFVLKHMHCQHHTDYIFPSQWQYIFSRRLAVAMALHPQPGRGSWIALFDSGIIKSLGLQFVHASDANVSNTGNLPVLICAWEDFFLSQG